MASDGSGSGRSAHTANDRFSVVRPARTVELGQSHSSGCRHRTFRSAMKMSRKQSPADGHKTPPVLNNLRCKRLYTPSIRAVLGAQKKQRDLELVISNSS